VPFGRTSLHGMKFCSLLLSDTKVTISPRYGIYLGGQTVKVQGPCFDSFSDIRCIFDGMEVRGVYLSELQALCISPMLSHAGSVQFAVKMDGEVYGKTIFTACKPVYLLVHNMKTYMNTTCTLYFCSITLTGTQCGCPS